MLKEMLKDKRLGLALIIIGVLANNYVYLNDIFLAKYVDRQMQNWIFFGQYAIIGAVVAVVVIAIGVIIFWRSQARGGTE